MLSTSLLNNGKTPEDLKKLAEKRLTQTQCKGRGNCSVAKKKF